MLVLPLRKKIFISIQNEPLLEKAASSRASQSPLKLNGRKLTHSTSKNLSEARKRIAQRSSALDDMKLNKQEESRTTNIVFNEGVEVVQATT